MFSLPVWLMILSLSNDWKKAIVAQFLVRAFLIPKLVKTIMLQKEAGKTLKLLVMAAACYRSPNYIRLSRKPTQISFLKKKNFTATLKSRNVVTFSTLWMHFHSYPMMITLKAFIKGKASWVDLPVKKPKTGRETVEEKPPILAIHSFYRHKLRRALPSTIDSYLQPAIACANYTVNKINLTL